LEGHKPKIPRVVAGIAIHTLPLGPMEGFVLSRIDATASVADISDLTSLPIDEVTRIVEKLMELGAVEWADGTIHLPRMSAKSIAPPRPSSPGRPSVAPGSSPGIDPGSNRPPAPSGSKGSRPGADAPPTVATANDGIELAPERRKRIDDLYVAIDLLDHYSVLGITRKAGKAEVRSAYFELSKIFHPDTAFRKKVGNYRMKMETIFKRLTEAYEVLGKKKAREEYDAYLESIGATEDAEKALSGETEIPSELLASPAAPEPPAATTPATPPPPMPPRSTPTEEGKRVARELLQKRLGAARPGTPSPSSSGSAPSPPDPTPAVERTKKEVLRDLASTLKTTAHQTGGLDRVTRMVAEAQRAETGGDLAGAVRGFKLALALAPERADIAAAHERVSRELAVTMAGQYESQASYEERHQKWGAAAISWAKVVEGRPKDVNALTRAARALVEAKGDLRQASRFAQQAVDLEPDGIEPRLTLGRVYFAAGLSLNAKRELEHVRKLDPSNLAAASMLKELATRSGG
jgi:tetratricopeptide (TPR) repeat protein